VSLTYWNGQLWPQGAVRITLDDAGFLFGDGLFETLRVDDGQALDAEAHLDRLLAGLARIGIGIPETREDLEKAVEKVAREAPGDVARLRITITRGTEGPTRLITTSGYDPPSEEQYRNGVAVLLLSDLRVDSQGPLVGLKSLSYQMNRLALRRAEAAGCFEALLLNERGFLVEGSRTNVVVALPEGVFTPPLSDGCLPGTVRRRLLEQGKMAERSLTPEDLARSEKVYLLNSLIGVLPVQRPRPGFPPGRGPGSEDQD
jgi:branched-chain amino acid aminotransferase